MIMHPFSNSQPCSCHPNNMEAAEQTFTSFSMDMVAPPDGSNAALYPPLYHCAPNNANAISQNNLHVPTGQQTPSYINPSDAITTTRNNGNSTKAGALPIGKDDNRNARSVLSLSSDEEPILDLASLAQRTTRLEGQFDRYGEEIYGRMETQLDEYLQSHSKRTQAATELRVETTEK